MHTPSNWVYHFKFHWLRLNPQIRHTTMGTNRGQTGDILVTVFSALISACHRDQRTSIRTPIGPTKQVLFCFSALSITCTSSLIAFHRENSTYGWKPTLEERCTCIQFISCNDQRQTSGVTLVELYHIKM